MRKLNLFIKRFFDIVVSFIGCLLCLPIWLIVILLMKITMPGPIFFKQERIGKNFRKFEILKFRTMKVDKEAETNFVFNKDNERITSLGKFLRRTKIDETPQLLNVLLGDMSLVGPRPTIDKKIKEFPKGQEIRLSMRPGMTGVSQTKGNILLSWERRIEYDCEYVENFNIFLDLLLIFKTIKVVFCGEESMISKSDLEKYKNPTYNNLNK